MEINRIEEFSGSGGVTRTGRQGGVRSCLYYFEEVCTAPRVKFAACRSCCRINPHKAASNLFAKIKQLAADIINLPEPEQPPRG
jgi:hypothetical protein